MPQIILKINNKNDKIYEDDNICCYIADTFLPDNVIDKIIKTNKLLLWQGENANEKAKTIGNGVVINTDPTKPMKAQIKPLRESLKSSKILGAVIEPSRHEAMLASETEPEFIALRIRDKDLSKTKELISWYNDLFLIQIAADMTEYKGDIKDFDVDFVIINSQDYADFSC